MIERIGAVTFTHPDGLKETKIYYRGEHPELGQIVQGCTGLETEMTVRNYIPREFIKDGFVRCDLCNPFTRCNQRVDTNEVEIDRNGFTPFTIRGDINECTKFRNSIGEK